MRLLPRVLLSCALTISIDAWAIDEFFDKSAGNMNGFLEVTDKTYLKECGSCHFAYSPGLLPAASWARIMSQPDKHFGDNIKLDATTSEAISRYLADNAADKSPYLGSQILVEKINPKSPPVRVMSVPRLRDKHYVMKEVIAKNGNIKVRTFHNCDGCHQAAAKGDFGYAELVVPGVHGIKKIKVDGFKAEKSLN